MSTDHNAAPTTPAPAPREAPGTTEVLSAERLWAYGQAALELGDVTVDVVAQPGDTMVVSPPVNGFRYGNPRDKGDLVGVNLDEVPNKRGVTTIEVPKNKYGVVVTTPLREHSMSGDRESLRDLYLGSNARYDQMRAERRKAQATEPTTKK